MKVISLFYVLLLDERYLSVSSEFSRALYILENDKNTINDHIFGDSSRKLTDSHQDIRGLAYDIATFFYLIIDNYYFIYIFSLFS